MIYIFISSSEPHNILLFGIKPGPAAAAQHLSSLKNSTLNINYAHYLVFFYIYAHYFFKKGFQTTQKQQPISTISNEPG